MSTDDGTPPPPKLEDTGLKPGWYWVKAFLTPTWELCFHDGRRWCIVRGMTWSTMLQGQPDVIGPRIEEPQL